MFQNSSKAILFCEDDCAPPPWQLGLMVMREKLAIFLCLSLLIYKAADNISGVSSDPMAYWFQLPYKIVGFQLFHIAHDNIYLPFYGDFVSCLWIQTHKLA